MKVPLERWIEMNIQEQKLAGPSFTKLASHVHIEVGLSLHVF